MLFTMFTSLFDREKVDCDRTWQQIVERAQTPREFPRKDAMPLLKLAQYGTGVRSPEGFLRNAANIEFVTGGEGDHDTGTLDPVDAIAALGMAQIRALIYFSPSYTPAVPRWRVLLPFSVALPPGHRAALMAKANAVLSGKLAAESFVLGQTFYWGRVAGAEYRTFATGFDLPCINERINLTAEIYPAGHAVGHVTANGAITGGATDGELRRVVLEGVPGEVYRALVALSARMVGRGMLPTDALATLRGLLDDCTWRERDPQTWRERYNDVTGLVASAVNRYGDRRDRTGMPVPWSSPVVQETPQRVEVVRTGVLIPRSVSLAHESEIESLDFLPPQRGNYPNTLFVCSTIAARAMNGRLWVDASTQLPMRGAEILSDVDAIRLTRRVNGLPAGQKIGDSIMHRAMIALAHDNPLDPWRDWLDGLTWDGTERLNSMGEDYFGVTVGADELERIVFRKLMLGVVARQYMPGAKFDLMIVLEGAQGTRKSTALRALFGDPYVASWEHDFNSKDFRQQLQGNVCIEVAELASFARSEMNAIKSIISETTDVYRPSYGRSVERHPRRCVMVGTSNGESYLSDVDGNRRFVPVKCSMIDVEGILREREQLFAEAVVAFKRGGADARWWELPARVEQEQADRIVDDPWRPQIEVFLHMRTEARVHELMRDPLLIPIERHTPGNARRVAGILRLMGWNKYRTANGKVWRP